MLSSPLEFTVKGPPLTASLESVPTSHNGSGEFRFRIAFSEEFSLSYKTLRDDHVFTVEGGKVTLGHGGWSRAATSAGRSSSNRTPTAT